MYNKTARSNRIFDDIIFEYEKFLYGPAYTKKPQKIILVSPVGEVYFPKSNVFYTCGGY